MHLKTLASKCGYKYNGYRDIRVQLQSGNYIKIKSPLFVKFKPSRKRGRVKKRRKVCMHFGLEIIGLINKKSPNLISLCVQTSVLCPSFELACKFLERLNVNVSHGFLKNICYSFGNALMQSRGEISLDQKIKIKGLRILICIDGGRIRERIKKRGSIGKDKKQHGYTTEWKEPKLFTISFIDENGKTDKSIEYVYDGTLGNADAMFTLLEGYLKNINLDEAESITFCADGGSWIWNRIPLLANTLKIKDYNEVLDYTHAKQNLRGIVELLKQYKAITAKQFNKVFKNLKNLLWNGKLSAINKYIETVMVKRRGKKSVMKKFKNYFKNEEKFQYSNFKSKNIPVGSGAVESAIRRILNLRIKGCGLFWKRENVEKIIFLRSQLLSGRWDIMMNNFIKYTVKAFTIGNLDDIEGRL